MRRNGPLTLTPLLVSAFVSFSALAAEPADSAWPQWRGPGGSGVAGSSELPLDWGLDRNLVWKTEIEGRGHSSPVIWGERIFLTTAIQGDEIPGAVAPIHHLGGEEFKHPDAMGSAFSHTLKVLAIDTTTGSVAWSRTAYEGRMYDDRHKAASYASPSVATDGERIFAYFGSEGIYAYTVDGEPIWDRDIGDIRVAGVGLGTSPVLYQNLVILQADEDEGELSFIVALDKATGEEAWKVDRAVQASWATPVLAGGTAGPVQLVTSGNELVIAYEPETGKEVWRAEGLGANAVHQPLLTDDHVILSSGYPAKVIKAYPLSLRGDMTGSDATTWTYSKGTAYVPSNLLYDGYIYLTNDGGVLTCLDAATGEVVYEGGRTEKASGPYMASLVAAGGRILMVNRDGDATIVKAGPKHEVLSSTTVDEPVYATPAIAGGRVYIRGERHLYALGSSG